MSSRFFLSVCFWSEHDTPARDVILRFRHGAIVRSIENFKPFVPSNDYATSKEFYQCMGFALSWDAAGVLLHFAEEQQ